MNHEPTVCHCDDCDMTEDEIYTREEEQSIVEEDDELIDKNFFIEY